MSGVNPIKRRAKRPRLTSATDNDFVRFSTDWKIKWSDFDGITEAAPLKKHFDTSYDNVVLQWMAKLAIISTVGNKIEFYLRYDAGPVENFKDMEYTIAVVKKDRSAQVIMSTTPYEVDRSFGKGLDILDKDAKKVQTKYGLSNMELIIRIALKIPISAFTITISQKLPMKQPPDWMIDLYNGIAGSKKSSFSNVKLISREKTVFYCHTIIGYQSKPLEAMFKHPPAEGKPKDEHEFPGMATESMKVFIRFLYTGEAILGDLSIDHVIELADIAEQYNLKSLKQACIMELWQSVVKDPTMCYQIIQLADLHQDMIHLKNRAMDVLVENYQNLEAHTKDLVREFGGGKRGEELRQEFNLFQYRRLQPFFG